MFPFEPIEVVAKYTHRQDESGLWFRLHDGRAFSSTGEPNFFGVSFAELYTCLGGEV